MKITVRGVRSVEIEMGEPERAAEFYAQIWNLKVVERKGRIVEVQNGVSSTFADLSSLTTCCDNEDGLQSLALAPDFGSSGRFYVFYTCFEGEIQVAEMRASGGFAPLSSLRPLLAIPHPGATNHYGGQLQIGQIRATVVVVRRFEFQIADIGGLHRRRDDRRRWCGWLGERGGREPDQRAGNSGDQRHRSTHE